MSLEAQNWAMTVPDLSSSQACVLFAIAFYANRETWEAFPSVMAIMKVTRQNRKTILAAIEVLRTSGFIVDTGKRRGRSGQVKVYRLNPECSILKGNSPKLGTVPNLVPFNNKKVPKTTFNGSEFTSKECRNRDSEPIYNYKELSAPEKSDWLNKLVQAEVCSSDIRHWFGNNKCQFSVTEKGVTLLHVQGAFEKTMIMKSFEQALRRAFPQGFQINVVQ